MIKRIAPYLRHLIAFALLYVSWHSLNQWYLYQHYGNFIIFFFLFVIALIIASAPFVAPRIRKLRESRVVIAFFIVLLLFPWGEILRLNFVSSRLDWSRQIFDNTIVIYSILLVFLLIPSIPNAISHFVVAGFKYVNGRTHRSWFWLFVILTFCWTAFLAEFIAHETPRIQDTAAHLFQAKIFSHGDLFAPAPPVAEFFSLQGDMLVIHSGRWFSMYPPGLAALLVLFMAIRATWLLCPLLGALTAALWMQYAKRWHGPKTSVLFGLLMVASPFIFLMSSTIMVHSLELSIASALFFLCRLETTRSSTLQIVLISILIAFAMIVRAFSMIPFVAPVLLYTAAVQFTRKQWLAPFVFLMAFIFGGTLLCLYQWKTTGDPFLSGYLLEYPGYRYGFGASYLGQIHTPGRGLEQISNNILGLNYWLTGWHTGTVFFLLAFFFTAPRFQTWDRLLLISCACLIVFYFFSAAQDLLYGPRFLYPLAPIPLLFIARSCRLDGSPHRPSVLVTALLFAALFLFLPLRLLGFVSQARPPLQATDLKEAMQNPEKRLIFLDPHIPQPFVNWNDPFLQTNAILCRDFGERNKLAEHQFASYRPGYFRMKIGMKNGNVDAHLRVFDTPDEHPPGYVSYFNLVMALEGADVAEQYDVFDTCYQQLFTASDADLQLVFLDAEASKTVEEPGYKHAFHIGVWHAGRMLLLPRLEYEKDPTGWPRKLNLDQFRLEFDTAIHSLQQSGEIGAKIVTQLQKARRRIDQDDNGMLSNEEIVRFLAEKLRLAA